MKVRKKPVIVDAWLVELDVSPLSGLESLPGYAVRRREDNTLEIYDKLHDTWTKFENGDWILRGVNGEYYPCKPDVFEKTYEI